MKTKRVLTVSAIGIAAALAVPSMASASYHLTKGEAQRNTRDAAETTYADYGVTYAGSRASCRPQSMKYDPHYVYHRWVCGWAAPNHEGDIVGGAFRITGHSNGTYGYLVLRGIRYAD